jgi:excisionase family DNA binding protein
MKEHDMNVIYRPASEPPRAILTLAETAQELRVSPMTVYRLLKTGQLHRKKIGRRSIVQRCELERFLDAADSSYPGGDSGV